MKLEPGERAILASFFSGPEAESAVRYLRKAGYETVQMDRVGSFGLSPDTDRERPAISGKESSLVDAVLNPDQQDANTAILLGATTEASGMSGAPTTTVPPFLVTVVTSQAQTEPAVAIIKECGGRV